MAVSSRTEAKLRQAMDRLLAGTPLHTDGALTKENLARDTRMSHATVHRAQQILAEWDTRVPRPVPTAQDTELAELRRRLSPANGRVTTLEGQLDALATPCPRPSPGRSDFPQADAAGRVTTDEERCCGYAQLIHAAKTPLIRALPERSGPRLRTTAKFGEAGARPSVHQHRGLLLRRCHQRPQPRREP